MKTSNLVCFIACMFNTFVQSVSALDKSPVEALGQTISHFAVSNVSLIQVVSMLNEECLSRGVVINLEASPKEATEKNMIKVDLKNTSIKNAIAKILEGNLNYVWDSNRNVINVIPADREHDPEYILNAKIERLEVQMKDRNEIINLVLMELDKKTRGKYQISVDGDTLDKLFVYRLPYEALGMAPPTRKKYNMTLENVTVRQILNLISEKEQTPWTAIPHNEIKDLLVLLFYDSKKSMSPNKHLRKE